MWNWMSSITVLIAMASLYSLQWQNNFCPLKIYILVFSQLLIQNVYVKKITVFTGIVQILSIAIFDVYLMFDGRFILHDSL